jgi:hypothetical protein
VSGHDPSLTAPFRIRRIQRERRQDAAVSGRPPAQLGDRQSDGIRESCGRCQRRGLRMPSRSIRTVSVARLSRLSYRAASATHRAYSLRSVNESPS